jgi:quinolinate synthase
MARRLGISLDQISLWHPRREADAEALSQAKIILWPGACNVHQRFRPDHVRAVRARFPGIRVLVHPECPMEVVDLSDDAGSTSYIIGQVDSAPVGSQWAIGTETRLVQRLQREHPGQFVVSLASVPPFCRTMSQITLDNLAFVLEALADGEMVNEVTVDADTARWARIALQRMLDLG